jgi:hypothetical protein
MVLLCSLSSLGAATVPSRFTGFRDRCSALVRFASGSLFVAHNTWSNYHTMLRVWKEYRLAFPGVRSVTDHRFSGYPGSLTSTDDYYELKEKGMVAVETTNSVFNVTLYRDFVGPECIVEWVRSIAANRLATSGQEWVRLFERHNSGTYNNQWMIVDLKRFVQGSETLANGTLWVAEQIPGTPPTHTHSNNLEFDFDQDLF